MKPKWTALAAGLWGGEPALPFGILSGIPPGTSESIRPGREPGSVDWPRLGQAALDRDLLGPVDLKLIRTVAARAGRPRDGALQAVLGCLLAAVRAGGLRIPAEPGPLALRLEAFLRGLHAVPGPGPAAASPEVGALGLAASAAASDAELPGLAHGLAQAFHLARLGGAYAAVLGEPGAFMPLLHSGRSLYFQKHQAAEAVAGIRLAALLDAPDREVDPAVEGNLLDTVLHRFPLRVGRGKDAPAMEFRGGQKTALSLGLRKRLLVVSGGPGTGKTSLVANLLRALIRLPGPLPGDPARPLRIRLAAPTGRAAQRLTESMRASLESVDYTDPEPEGGSVAKAAMAEAALDGSLSGLAGETLHRLLRYQPGRGEFFHRRSRPIPADVVVVDEVSMVDIFALSRLLDALEDGASLILLGDMDQLPSVEAGAVLADLVPGSGAGDEASPLADRLVVLDRSHRSDPGILEVTRRINSQEGDAALAAMPPPFGFESGTAPWPLAFFENARKVAPGGGCRLILPPKSPGRPDTEATILAAAYGPGLPALLESWVGYHYLEHSQDPAQYPGKTLAAPRRASYATLIGRLASAGLPLSGLDGTAPDAMLFPASAAADAAWFSDLDPIFAYLDQARILAFTRKGWHGTMAINRRIRDRLAPVWDPQGPPPGQEGFHGAPIMIQENDYGQDLFNGEVGALLRIRGRYLAFFRKEGGYRAYPAGMLPRHELAFASTIHKAQGSEYDQVLLILPEAGNRLLFKETLYTAITRARFFAGVYGPREVFLEAVGRKVVRESGLREFLSAQVPPGAA